MAKGEKCIQGGTQQLKEAGEGQKQKLNGENKNGKKRRSICIGKGL